jgi:hypothetical protein
MQPTTNACPPPCRRPPCSSDPSCGRRELLLCVPDFHVSGPGWAFFGHTTGKQRSRNEAVSGVRPNSEMCSPSDAPIIQACRSGLAPFAPLQRTSRSHFKWARAPWEALSRSSPHSSPPPCTPTFGVRSSRCLVPPPPEISRTFGVRMRSPTCQAGSSRRPQNARAAARSSTSAWKPPKSATPPPHLQSLPSKHPTRRLASSSRSFRKAPLLTAVSRPRQVALTQTCLPHSPAPLRPPCHPRHLSLLRQPSRRRLPRILFLQQAAVGCGPELSRLQGLLRVTLPATYQTRILDNLPAVHGLQERPHGLCCLASRLAEGRRGLCSWEEAAVPRPDRYSLPLPILSWTSSLQPSGVLD